MIETINKNKANFNMSLQLKNLAKMFDELDQAPTLYQPSKFWQGKFIRNFSRYAIR